jgi:hypothetical protein
MTHYLVNHHITGNLVFFFCPYRVSCDWQSRPLRNSRCSYSLSSRQNTSAAEIRRDLCAVVYGQNLMSEGTVRQWRRMFKNGRTMLTMKSEVVGRTTVLSDDLVQRVDQKNL